MKFLILLSFVGLVQANSQSHLKIKDKGVPSPTIHAPEDGRFVEGDMKIDEKDSQNRNALKDPNRLWKKDSKGHAIVPYVYQESGDMKVDDAIKHAVTAASLMYAENTCIRFVPRTNEEHFITIIRDGGCWSSVGYTRSATQKLSLGPGCQYRGVAAHEMMHAVGFYHEQSRPDRDEWVTIVKDNIKPKSAYNFNKCSSSECTTQGLPYDYGRKIIGHRDDFSELDKKKLNKLYKCDQRSIGDDLDAPTSSGCPLGWDKLDNKCFFDTWKSYPFNEAKRVCAQKKASLPSPKDQREWKTLESYFKKNGISVARLGFERVAERQNKWKLSNGQAANFLNFKQGEPGDTEKCIASVSYDNYQWHDWLCKDALRIVCWKDAQ